MCLLAVSSWGAQSGTRGTLHWEPEPWTSGKQKQGQTTSSHFPVGSGVGVRGNIGKLLTCCAALGLPLRQGGHLTRAVPPPPRHRPSEQPGRARGRLWRGARVKADDPGACREPCLLSWAVGPAGLGDQKLMLSRPLPQVWCNPRAQARTVSQDKCQRKPPGWSGSHSTGAAWSSETLRDTTEPRLAGDRSRPFLCPLSLCISTRVPHLPPPGALQAFRGGLLRPLGLSAHGE